MEHRGAILLTLLLSLLASAAVGDQKDQKGKEYARLDFVVLKDYNGKPIRNASVVLHPVDEDGKQERGGVQLKTDSEGKAFYEGVPYGSKLRVQVIAPQFQTYGEDLEVNQPRHEMVIRLKRPQKQHSIYE